MSGVEAGSLVVAIVALGVTLGQLITPHSVKGHLKKDLALIDGLYALLDEHMEKMEPEEVLKFLDEIAGLKRDCGRLEIFAGKFLDRWDYGNRQAARELTKKCKLVKRKCQAASTSAIEANCTKLATGRIQARLSSGSAASVSEPIRVRTADLLNLDSEQVSRPRSSSIPGQQSLSGPPSAVDVLSSLGSEPERAPDRIYAPSAGDASESGTAHDDVEDLFLLIKGSNLMDEASDGNVVATPALTPTVLRHHSPDPMLIRLTSGSARQASASHGEEGSPNLQSSGSALTGEREAGVAGRQVIGQRTYRSHIVRSPTQSFELADFKAATIISSETSREHIAKELTGDQAFTGEQLFNMIHSAVVAGQHEEGVQPPQHSQSIRRPRRQRTTMSLASLD